MKKKDQGLYVIGVDGGATKTKAALADLNEKIIKTGKAGSSNPRNVGIKKAVDNIAKSVKQVLNPKNKIASTFIGLAAVEEEYKLRKKEIKKEILKHKEISPIFKGKIIIGSDQLVAFRSGTIEKEGISLIAGTGAVVRGWRKNKDFKSSGWGWLNDEGSGFWTGRRGLSRIFKELDKREKASLITKITFREWRLKNNNDLLKKVYSENFIKTVASISLFLDWAAKKGDQAAELILKEAGKKLSQTATSVIKELNFQNEKFPLVLVGKTFNSEIILREVKKEIKKIAPRVNFIEPKNEPVLGAVRLATEEIYQNGEN